MHHELPNDLEILRKYQNWVQMEPNTQSSSRKKTFVITVKNHAESSNQPFLLLKFCLISFTLL